MNPLCKPKSEHFVLFFSPLNRFRIYRILINPLCKWKASIYDATFIFYPKSLSKLKFLLKYKSNAYTLLSHSVGMTGFEPATTRPPAVYANRTAPHPESSGKNSEFKKLGKQELANLSLPKLLTNIMAVQPAVQ
jgi:hypothetical protein